MNEQKIIKQFAENVKMEFFIKAVTVYKNDQKLYGANIDSATIEKYLSLPCTTVYKDTGSKFVTRFSMGSDIYIIELSSEGADTFDGLEAEYIISDIKKLIGKLGD